MSYSRYQEMLRSVPANARKLYDIIPIAEGWNYSQIHQEAQRRGLNFRSEVIMGCVGELKDAGLVTTSENLHRRTPHKDKPELISVSKDIQHVDPIKTRPAAAAQAKSATDRLTDLAGRIEKLGNVANMLVTEAKAISEDLADVAVAIEESEGATSKELQTLRTLKALLRD